MPSLDELNHYQPTWLFHNAECMRYGKVLKPASPLNSLFNLTWTYRTDSDFWSPYGTYEQLSPEDIKMKEIATTKDYTVGKTELVA